MMGFQVVSFAYRAIGRVTRGPNEVQLREALSTARRSLAFATLLCAIALGFTIDGKPLEGFSVCIAVLGCVLLAVGARLVGAPPMMVIAPLPFLFLGLLFYAITLFLVGALATPVIVLRDLWRLACHWRGLRMNRRAGARLVEDARDVVHRYAARLEHSA